MECSVKSIQLKEVDNEIQRLKSLYKESKSKEAKDNIVKLSKVRKLLVQDKIEEVQKIMGSSEGKRKITKKHKELEKGLWKDTDKMLDLFDELALLDNDTEHNTYLKGVLKEVLKDTSKPLNEFTIHLNKEAKANMGFAVMYGGKDKLVLNTTTSSIDADDMTATEVYVHEIIHMATEYARTHNTGPISDIAKGLGELYTQASKEITKETLEKYTTKEKAKRIWKYVFDNRNGDGISEFVAYGMTNKAMMKALKDVTVKKPKFKQKSDGMWDTMMQYLVDLYVKLADSLAKSNKGKRGDERLNWFVTELRKHNSTTYKKNDLLFQIREGVDYTFDKSDKAVKWTTKKGLEALDYTTDKAIDIVGDNVIGDTLTISKGLVKGLNVFRDVEEFNTASRRISEFNEMVGPVGLGNILAPEGTIMTTVKYLGKDDDMTKRMEVMALFNSKLDRTQNSTTQSVGKALLKELKGVSVKEQQTMTEVLIDTDMRVLLGSMEVGDISRLLSDETYLKENIDKYTKDLNSMTDGFRVGGRLNNYYKSQIKGLGRHLVTGESGLSIQKTATDIVMLRGSRHNDLTSDFIEDSETVVSLTNIIDKLVTLESIQHLDSKKKQTIVDIIEKRPKGVELTLAAHASYVRAAIKYAEETTYTTLNGRKVGLEYPHKGETRDESAGELSSKVMPDTEVVAKKLKALGYKRRGKAAVDGMAIYVSNTSTLMAYDKQAMPKINIYKKLHSAKDALNYGQEDSLLHITRADLATKFERVYDEEVRKQLEGVVEPTVDGYVAFIGRGNKLSDIGASVGNEVYKKAMKQDRKVPLLLGKMIAEIDEKKAAVKLTNNVMLDVEEDHIKNYKRGKLTGKNQLEYIEIGPEAKNRTKEQERFAKEIWESAPQLVKDRVRRQEEGKQYLPIRRDLARGIFGARAPSVLDVRVPFTEKALKQHLEENHLKIVSDTIRLIGDLWSEMISMQKVDIVIRTPMVTINNILSNINWSSALGGQFPWEVITGQLKALRTTFAYLRFEDEERELLNSIRFNKLSKSEIKEKKRRLRQLSELKSNSGAVHTLMKAGLYTSIEEMTDEDLTTDSRIKRTVKEYTEWVPQIVKDGFNTMYITEETGLFRLMLKTVQVSDFIARVNRFNVLIAQGYSESDAMKIILDDFVNYNRMDGDFIRWINSVGTDMFTKYPLGAAKSLVQRVQDRPTAMIAMASLLDAPNPTDSFGARNWDNPYESLVDGSTQNILPPSAVEAIIGGVKML